MLEIFNPNAAYEALRAFLVSGGNVLIVIMCVTFFMWALIIERMLFWTMARDSVERRAVRAWAARSDHRSWYALAIRDRLISEARQDVERFNGIIRALVAVTPLLGLLGTVTGMVEVFDVLAVTGSSNARLLAAGISKATIPTMSGLVASLSGLIFINAFERGAAKATNEIADKLVIE
ncbi:MAG: MotA/TolQ/ExbB proton channel family protein [Amphiplicatus sp.]